MITERGTLEEFVEDITPFFYGKRLTYVDVGAFKGVVLNALLKSKLTIRESHLFEVNPKTYENLKLSLEAEKVKHVHFYNMALSDSIGTLKFKDNDSMTKAISNNDTEISDVFSVESITLDSFSKNLTEEHISILKVDVEGHEKEVFVGAKNILANQQVDLIYVEAGMNKDNKQQSYYRDIDDILASHGYKIFRIYEQMFEWMEDSPFLRRVNIAYMSEKFARNNPFRLANQVFTLSNEKWALDKELKNNLKKHQDELGSKEQELSSLSLRLETLEKDKEQLNELKEDNSLLLTQLHYLQKELENQVEKAPKIIVKQEERILGAVDKIKKQLTYRMGNLIIRNSKSFFGILFMPILLIHEYKTFKYEKSKENNKNNIKLHLYADYDKAEKLKNHLSYKLGEVFLEDMKSIFGVFKFPFSAFKIVREFKKSKQQA